MAEGGEGKLRALKSRLKMATDARKGRPRSEINHMIRPLSYQLLLFLLLLSLYDLFVGFINKIS